MDDIKRVEKIEQLKEKRMEAVRLLGRYSKRIKREFYEESKSHLKKTMMVRYLQSPKNQLGVTIATSRLKHYADTAIIAMKIARGLFPNDEEYANGVGILALFHDCGQTPFGHDGESALTRASEEFNGGPRLHNIDGAMDILYRRKPRIINAIKEGITEDIIAEEAEIRRISTEELKHGIDAGLETELSEKISNEIEKNKELMDEAVWVMATATGNHNGERGIANIEPDYGRTNEAFYNQALKTYIDREEDKKMRPCSMADAIVKISDQISSIPNDVIDAKLAGIEETINEKWAEPISKILTISTEEAKQKLKGTTEELQQMVKAIQKRLINSVVNSSTQERIDMDLALLMYQMRKLNPQEHQVYTSTAKSEQILINSAIDATELFAKSILVENRKVFLERLNRLFRIPVESPMRKQAEKLMRQEFNGPEVYRDFYYYVIGLSAEEFKMNKDIVKELEIKYFKPIILKTLKNQKGLRDNTIERSMRGTTDYLVEAYLHQNLKV